MESSKEWVDFKIIKAAVTIEMVLDHYGVTNLKKSGYELRGKGPIHRGSNNKHFSANLSKNVFKCFFAQCNAHGNVLEFVAAMDQCSIRDAALKLKNWFQVGERKESSSDDPHAPSEQAKVACGVYEDQDGALFEVVINAFSGEDFEPLVVYRELFGEYCFFVCSDETLRVSTAGSNW